MAVLNAYMSAGAAHGIASACHENVIDGCKCQQSTQTRREGDVLYLTTCGDDVDFATRVLRTLTGLEIGNALSQAVDLVSQWNNEIGYRVRSGLNLLNVIKRRGMGGTECPNVKASGKLSV